MEGNGIRSEDFALSRSIRRCCPLLSSLCNIGGFPSKVKFLHGISLTGATKSARYSVYAGDVSFLGLKEPRLTARR